MAADILGEIVMPTKITRAALGFAAVLGLAVPASAQVSVPATPAVVAAPTAATSLRAGTSVPLRTLEQLTTNGKQLRVGQRFNLETTGAVAANGMVVIPVGSRAVAEVTNVRNKGMWGKSGAIHARMISVNVNGRDVRMSGTFDSKGQTGTAGVVGAIAVLPVAGFFMTGTSATMPINMQVTGYLDEDVLLAAN